MSELIKEELLGTVRKKRFIILIALAYISAVIFVFYRKGDFWTDLTYLSAIDGYLFCVFNALAGSILILSAYRKKYTRNSILQIEEKGAKRYEGVLSRFISGSVILIGCYLVFAVVFLILGPVSGAHNTPEQIGFFILKIALSCLASIAAYSAALFWLYLFAFPIVPILGYVISMMLVPAAFKDYLVYDSVAYAVLTYIIPKVTADDAYTHLVLADPKVLNAVSFMLEIAVPLLLTVLVFNLKKLKPLKGEKGSEGVSETVSVAAGEPAGY